MITEVNRLCADQQQLPTAAGTTASEAILDNVRQAPVYDGTLHFIVSVTNEPKGGTSIQAKIQTSPDNSTWSDIADSGVVKLADIPDSGVIFDRILTDDFKGERYWRVNFVTVGTFSTAPIVTAGEFTEGAPRYRRDFRPGASFKA